MIVHSTDHKNQTLGNSTRGHSTTIHPLGIIRGRIIHMGELFKRTKIKQKE